MVLQENFTFDNLNYIWQYSLHMTIFFDNLKTLEEQYITLIWDWEQQFEEKAGVTKSIYFGIPFIVHDALNLRVAVNWIPKYVHLAALAFFPNYVPIPWPNLPPPEPVDDVPPPPPRQPSCGFRSSLSPTPHRHA